jgi:hypothetical protein
MLRKEKQKREEQKRAEELKDATFAPSIPAASAVSRKSAARCNRFLFNNFKK